MANEVADLAKVAFGLVWDEFGDLVRSGGEEAREKAKILARGVAKYWLAAAKGEARAKKNMEWLHSELELFLARYAVLANAAARKVAQQWLSIVAKVGEVILRLVLAKGGLVP